MAKLVFLLDGNVATERVLDKTRITIGRRASNDIHIDNLAISGQHAVVVTTEEGTYIKDLNSTNGVVFNKVKVKKHMFAAGDLVRLGKYKVRYLQDETIQAAQEAGFESTVLVEPTETMSGESQLAAEQADNEPKSSPRLTILNGDDVGSTLLLDKAIVKIGQPNVQLALVTKRTQGYFISHVVGDDDLLVNGRAVDTHARALRHGDEIEMLGVKMQFSCD